MLTESQIALMDQLTDEFVDDQVVVDKTEIEMIMEPIRSNPDVYERWNIWNATVSTSTPVVSGSAQSGSSCGQNGNTPCASCDCC